MKMMRQNMIKNKTQAQKQRQNNKGQSKTKKEFIECL